MVDPLSLVRMIIPIVRKFQETARLIEQLDSLWGIAVSADVTFGETKLEQQINEVKKVARSLRCMVEEPVWKQERFCATLVALWYWIEKPLWTDLRDALTVHAQQSHYLQRAHRIAELLPKRKLFHSLCSVLIKVLLKCPDRAIEPQILRAHLNLEELCVKASQEIVGFAAWVAAYEVVSQLNMDQLEKLERYLAVYKRLSRRTVGDLENPGS